MVEIRKFEIEFVKRTKKIVDTYNGEYSFSNLINCTLGLLILPYENITSTDIWQKDINEIAHLPSFEIIKFQPIRSIINDEISYYPRTLEMFLKKIRNGLAHQNIIPINTQDGFSSIKISNKFLATTDLEIIFTEDQLREFTIFISELYLDENNS